MAQSITPHTIFTDFLSELGVKHTEDYSVARFGSIPFKSLFGLSKLLNEYGVETVAMRLGDKEEISMLRVPFIAATPEGFVIVTELGAETVGYLTQGQRESMPLDRFKEAWTGVVLTAEPTPQAIEPDYAAHRRNIFFAEAKSLLFKAGIIALFAFFFISGGLYSHWSTIGVAVVDLLGLWLTYMLMQKSLKIKSKTADRVCGVLEAGGCDSVLEKKASSFFGIFSWSEVGFAYFSVSLLCLLIFPGALPWLALCNLCCLPFTLWSIWYQKFRAGAWCTLCVSVQISLWLLFFCYAGGGWLSHAWPLKIDFFVLGVAYLTALLGINRLSPLLTRGESDTADKIK